jgi:nucleotide-binding universal stress UspA family protein
MKVLIAYDGSPCADDAIEDLRRAGLPDDVEALVLSVADVLLPPPHETTPNVRITALIGEARANAAAMLKVADVRAVSAVQRLRAAFPAWQVQGKAIADSPAWGVVREAESWQADLIVVGSQGHSAIGRLVLGSVSQTVLTHAPCSVRIGRSGRTAPNRPLRILVGIDGSPESEMAVRAAAGRIWPSGTDIRLMMVVEPSLLDAMSTSAAQAKQAAAATNVAGVNVAGGQAEGVSEEGSDLETEDAIQKHLASQLALFDEKAMGVTVSTMLLPGNPKQVLVEEAASWGADGIFIGSRGLNRWERLLLGSVSTAVAARAHCPVEVIRPPRAPA